jgi:hypothetical protein
MKPCHFVSSSCGTASFCEGIMFLSIYGTCRKTQRYSVERRVDAV